jgi:hypothetical protein
MRVVLFLAMLLLACFSCERPWRFTKEIDNAYFRISGKTLVEEPVQLSTKELHLDTGTLVGRKVILAGEVAFVGEYATYVVVSDDSGRILVKLTDIKNAESVMAKLKSKKLSVLGTLERGKKGLPFLVAEAIADR